MHSVMFFVSLLIQAALLYLVYVVSQELLRVRTLLENQPQPWMRIRPSGETVVQPSVLSGGALAIYSIWTWRGTRWELELGSVPPGYEPSGSPKFQGSFHGQRVKTECVRC